MNEIAQKKEDRIEYLEKQNRELLDAISYFCRRVENGSIRSVNTYAMYKELLNKYEVNKVR